MPKFYKNTKTGVVITEAEYKEKILEQATDISPEIGSMGMDAYSEGVNDAFAGEMLDYDEYVPYDPNEEEQ